MKRIKMIVAGLLTIFTLLNSFTALAAESLNIENCGAYLFEWRPVDFGGGQAFAILVGGDTIYESDIILNRGYDYSYTFDPGKYPRPWGQVPALVNIDGVWGIPENWNILPEGSQPTSRIVLYTNNKNMDSNERYIYVVHLPGGVDTNSLPDSVRKYLINVDGSDAGAYNGTITTGWYKDTDGNGWKFRQLDGSFVKNRWVNVNGESYYIDENGFMMSDTVTPDGFYVNASGVKQSYMPGWVEVDGQWKYVQKNGYYAAATWIQDTDGKYYYFNMATRMLTDEMTPDGYYVDANGVWDGQPSTIKKENNLGPGGAELVTSNEGWEEAEGFWKYRLPDGNYVTNSWKQDIDGKWYYFNESSHMVTNSTTPDGFYVGDDGAWAEESATE